MSLWNAVCSVLLCFSVRKRTIARPAGEFYLSQSTQSLRRFLAHISSPQRAFGIQRTQSVSAIVDTDKGQQAAYILLIGVSRWSLPFPSGEGSGEGPLSFWHLSSFVIMSFCLKKTPVFICHYVILSKKTHLSSFVIMSLCLKKNTLSPLMPCVLLSKDVYVCIFYKLSIISLHTQFFLLNLHN